MALKTFVKVSTVNNLSDARYCAGMEVDIIGFNLEKNNPNYISLEEFKELTEWLSGVEYEGEFENSDVSEIEETIKSYKIGHVQISDPSLVEHLVNLGVTVTLKLPLDRALQLPENLEINHLLITGQHEEISSSEISQIKQLNKRYDVLLGTGFTHENVEELLSKTGVKGISLQGGDELRPGYKDYDELADILEALEIE